MSRSLSVLTKSIALIVLFCFSFTSTFCYGDLLPNSSVQDPAYVAVRSLAHSDPAVVRSELHTDRLDPRRSTSEPVASKSELRLDELLGQEIVARDSSLVSRKQSAMSGTDFSGNDKATIPPRSELRTEHFEIDDPAIQRNDVFGLYLREIWQPNGFLVTEASWNRRRLLSEIAPDLEKRLQGILGDPDLQIVLFPLGSSLKGIAGAKSDMDFQLVVESDKIDQSVLSSKLESQSLISKMQEFVDKKGYSKIRIDALFGNAAVMTVNGFIQEYIASPRLAGLYQSGHVNIMKGHPIYFLPALYNGSLAEKIRARLLKTIAEQPDDVRRNIWTELTAVASTYIDLFPVKHSIELEDENPGLDLDDGIGRLMEERKKLTLPSFETMLSIYHLENISTDRRSELRANIAFSVERGADREKQDSTFLNAKRSTLFANNKSELRQSRAGSGRSLLTRVASMSELRILSAPPQVLTIKLPGVSGSFSDAPQVIGRSYVKYGDEKDFEQLRVKARQLNLDPILMIDPHQRRGWFWGLGRYRMADDDEAYNPYEFISYNWWQRAFKKLRTALDDMIPHPGAILIANALQKLDLKGKTVLDAGTGDGILAIQAAKSGANVIAIDIRSDLVRLAKRNAKLNAVDKKAKFITGDFGEITFKEQGSVDVIVMNLPSPGSHVKSLISKYPSVKTIIVAGSFKLPHQDIFDHSDAKAVYRNLQSAGYKIESLLLLPDTRDRQWWSFIATKEQLKLDNNHHTEGQSSETARAELRSPKTPVSDGVVAASADTAGNVDGIARAELRQDSPGPGQPLLPPGSAMSELRSDEHQVRRGVLDASAASTKNVERTAMSELRMGGLLHDSSHVHLAVSLPIFSLRRGQGDPGIGKIPDLAGFFSEALLSKGIDVVLLLPHFAVMDESPYAPASLYAIHELLVDWSLAEEVMNDPELMGRIAIDPGMRQYVHYPEVRKLHRQILRRAYEHFVRDQLSKSTPRAQEFEAFCKKQGGWLDDYTMFMAIHDLFMDRDGQQKPSHLWAENELKKLIADNRDSFETYAGMHRYAQWIGYGQLTEAIRVIHERGGHVLFDLPMFRGKDSVDTWKHPEYFQDIVNAHPGVVRSDVDEKWEDLAAWRWERLKERSYAFVLDPVRHWLDFGFDGARIDALHFAYDFPGKLSGKFSPGDDFVRELFEIFKAREAFPLAEAFEGKAGRIAELGFVTLQGLYDPGEWVQPSSPDFHADDPDPEAFERRVRNFVSREVLAGKKVRVVAVDLPALFGDPFPIKGIRKNGEKHATYHYRISSPEDPDYSNRARFDAASVLVEIRNELEHFSSALRSELRSPDRQDLDGVLGTSVAGTKGINGMARAELRQSRAGSGRSLLTRVASMSELRDSEPQVLRRVPRTSARGTESVDGVREGSPLETRTVPNLERSRAELRQDRSGPGQPLSTLTSSMSELRSARLEIKTPETEADRSELRDAVQRAQAILASSTPEARSELREMLSLKENSVSETQGIGFHWDATFEGSMLPVAEHLARQRRIVGVVYATRSELRLIEKVNAELPDGCELLYANSARALARLLKQHGATTTVLLTMTDQTRQALLEFYDELVNITGKLDRLGKIIPGFGDALNAASRAWRTIAQMV